jgi:hypothetical protein
MKERILTPAEIKRLADAGIEYPWSPWQSLQLLDRLDSLTAQVERAAELLEGPIVDQLFDDEDAAEEHAHRVLPIAAKLRSAVKGIQRQPRCDHDWQAPPNGKGASVCAKCDQRAPATFKCSSTLTFEFPDEDAANDFKSWLCDGGGEQSFWCDDKRFVHFDYFHGSVVPCEWRESE